MQILRLPGVNVVREGNFSRKKSFLGYIVIHVLYFHTLLCYFFLFFYPARGLKSNNLVIRFIFSKRDRMGGME